MNLNKLRKKVRGIADEGLSDLVDTLLKKYEGACAEKALLEYVKLVIGSKRNYSAELLNRLIENHERIRNGIDSYQGSDLESAVNDKVFTTTEFDYTNLENVCESLGVCEERIVICFALYENQKFEESVNEIVFDSLKQGPKIVNSICDVLTQYQNSNLQEDIINFLYNSFDDHKLEESCNVLTNYQREIEDCIESYEGNLRLIIKGILFRFCQENPKSLKKLSRNLMLESTAFSDCFKDFEKNLYRVEIVKLLFDIAEKSKPEILAQTCDVLMDYNNRETVDMDVINFVTTFYRLERPYSWSARCDIEETAQRILKRHGEEAPKKLKLFFDYLNGLQSRNYETETCKVCRRLSSGLVDDER